MEADDPSSLANKLFRLASFPERAIFSWASKLFMIMHMSDFQKILFPLDR